MTFYLGLTGGIATGKSTADRFFENHGINVIDADRIAHQQLAVGQIGWQNIETLFGRTYFKPDLTIDRRRLGEYVFHHPDARRKLEALNHPAIMKQIGIEMAAVTSGLCIVDVPLLFENQQQARYDATLLITLPQELQINRLMTRNHLNREQAMARIKSQMPLSQKAVLATYVISNTGTSQNLFQKLELLLAQLISCY